MIRRLTIQDGVRLHRGGMVYRLQGFLRGSYAVLLVVLLLAQQYLLVTALVLGLGLLRVGWHWLIWRAAHRV